MMSAREIAEIWKEIVKIYKNTREEDSPEETMCNIIHKFGAKRTEEVFATVAAIKKHDGRIYGENRDYMDSIPVDPKNVEWRNGNPVIYAGLDDIHTSHINQLITELRKYVLTVEIIEEQCNAKENIGIDHLFDSDIYEIQEKLKQRHVYDVEFSYIEKVLDALVREDEEEK